MTEKLYFSYKSIGNYIKLLATIKFENTHNAEDITIWHEKLIENNEADYYLLSCHEEVRNELKARGLKYIIVMPYTEYQNEYVKRWLRRGSDIDFITKMNERWLRMIRSCVEDTAPKIYLDEHEYLSDILTI